MERSYIASETGLRLAKQEFKKKGWTQQILADFAGCSRPVVSNFFQRKAIDKQKFIGICEALKLEWTDIAELDILDRTQLQDIAIDQLVTEIRASIKDSVEKECGTMRVLDMTRPIELNDIYTQVNILEKIIGRRRFNLDQFLQDCNLEEFDRFGLSRIKQKRVLGLEAVKEHDKLMILGKPGVGKTTFLKYLAIQCNRGKFAENKVPIFISLKKYAETPNQPDLPFYIIQWFENCNIVNASKKFWRILEKGRGLILLDGLDEVREEDSQRIIRSIEDLFWPYGKNQFAVTCRIAAREYTFTQFTEVEVADFDESQIKSFVTSWFEIKKLPKYPQHFMEQLKANPTIQELANNPLLLTLLCLEFEDSGSFPSDRADLYARATNTLLRKWDDKRHIYREQVYKELTPKRKEGLLSQIAFKTFDKKEYFFKQRTIERYIGEYICNLPTAPQEQTDLDIDSQAVLKSIEGQHGLLVERARGIYSFSHLTFQEYFTARKIATISNPDALETALIDLASHVTEKRWQEVFLLTAGMLEPADRLLLLMKRKIEKSIAKDSDLQKLLVWARNKSNSVKADYKIAAIRALYISRDLDLFRHLYCGLSRSLEHSLDHYFNHYLNSDLSRFLDLASPLEISRDLDLDHYLSRSFEIFCALNRYLDRYLELDPSLSFSRSIQNYLNLSITLCKDEECKRIIEKLLQRLPNPDISRKYKKYWWKVNGAAWSKELRQAMIKYRNIGHQWDLKQEQIELLDRYLTANQLLVDCLNGECYVSRKVREDIENTLLLPFADLNK